MGALLLHTMLTSQTVKAVDPEMEEPLTPKEPPVYETAEGERKWRCKDFMVGLIFLTGVSFMLFGLIHNREALEQKWDSATDSLKTEFGALSAAQTVGASFGVAVVFSAIWLIFVRYCVKVAVYGLFAMTLAAEAAGAGGLFYLANTQVADGTWEQTWLNGFAVVVTLLFAYTSYIVYSLCDRVALAASMIKVAGRVLQEVPTVFAVDALLAVVKFLWMIFCGAAAWAIIGNTTQDTFWVGTGLALMSYWGLQVLGNIVLVASYGALGQWYYNNRATMAGPRQEAIHSPVGHVLHRPCAGRSRVHLRLHQQVRLRSGGHPRRVLPHRLPPRPGVPQVQGPHRAGQRLHRAPPGSGGCSGWWYPFWRDAGARDARHAPPRRHQHRAQLRSGDCAGLCRLLPGLRCCLHSDLPVPGYGDRPAGVLCGAS